MESDSGNGVEYDDLNSMMAELSELRHRHRHCLIGFLRHRRLLKNMGSVREELENIRILFASPGLTAVVSAAQPQIPAHAKSGFLASLSVLCMRLSEIASAAMRQRDSIGKVVRRLAEWLISQLVGIMENAKRLLAFKDWSLSVSAGFPTGISYSITIDFQ